MTFGLSFKDFENIPSKPRVFDVSRQANVFLIISIVEFPISYGSFSLYSFNTAWWNYC